MLRREGQVSGPGDLKRNSLLARIPPETPLPIPELTSISLCAVRGGRNYLPFQDRPPLVVGFVGFRVFCVVYLR